MFSGYPKRAVQYQDKTHLIKIGVEGTQVLLRKKKLSLLSQLYVLKTYPVPKALHIVLLLYFVV